LLLAPALFAAYALLARYLLHGPVSASRLFVSVAQASDSGGGSVGAPGLCRRIAAPRGWLCQVPDRRAYGVVSYRVGIRCGGSCWAAQITDDYTESGMPKRVDGCVHRWQWSLSALLW